MFLFPICRIHSQTAMTFPDNTDIPAIYSSSFDYSLRGSRDPNSQVPSTRKWCTRDSTNNMGTVPMNSSRPHLSLDNLPPQQEMTYAVTPIKRWYGWWSLLFLYSIHVTINRQFYVCVCIGHQYFSVQKVCGSNQKRTETFLGVFIIRVPYSC